MADWAKPTISSNYLEVLALLGARDTDAATQFANGTAENTPVGAVKFSRTARRWEAWNGDAWAPLAAKYAISIDGEAGAVQWSGVTGKPEAFTPAAHSHAAAELGALLGNAMPKPGAASASAGTAAKAAREDHAHQLPANATQSAAGLMSAADKAVLDGLPGQVTAVDAKATAAASAATSADGKATEAKATADGAKQTADGMAANINSVDVKATNAASVAASAYALADTAKSSADSSVKTVNGVAPVGGNVALPGADSPNSAWNSIGSIILARIQVSSGVTYTPGLIVDGSSLAPANAAGWYFAAYTPQGSWRAHGAASYNSSTVNASGTTVWQRIA